MTPGERAAIRMATEYPDLQEGSEAFNRVFLALALEELCSAVEQRDYNRRFHDIVNEEGDRDLARRLRAAIDAERARPEPQWAALEHRRALRGLLYGFVFSAIIVAVLGAFMLLGSWILR